MKSKPWSVKLVLVIATMAIAAMLLNCGATWAAKSGSIVAWGDNTYGQCDVPTTNSGFVAVAAGYGYGYSGHSLGLKEDGSIVAWGYNGSGQCNVPSPNSGFVAVAAGCEQSIGLKGDGSIVAWGTNGYGQCNAPSPNSGFVAVATGFGHSIGLKGNGSIVAWGWNGYGECNVPSPNSGFVAVAASVYHNLGLKEDGSIVAWGYNDYGQCNVPSPNGGFVAVAGGYEHSLGLKGDGSIVAWGDNTYGQCDVPTTNSGFIAIAAGYEHSLGLKEDGSIVAWGDNTYGQCDVPTTNSDFVAIAAGYSHSLGITTSTPPCPNKPTLVSPANGSIVGSLTPTLTASAFHDANGHKHSASEWQVDDNSDFSSLAWDSGEDSTNKILVTVPSGKLSSSVKYYWRVRYKCSGGNWSEWANSRNFTTLIHRTGSIVAWGDNTYGQCNVPSPNSSFVAVAAGYGYGYSGHSLGLKEDGSIVAWGYNGSGQCNVPSPNSGFVAVAAGCEQSIGLKGDGSIVAWGTNGYGQCNAPSPNSGFVAVATGFGHSIGLKGDGSIVAWGWNGYGECNVPSPNSGFVAVAAGVYHNLGLKEDGSIVAWGYNYYGQCNVPSPNSGFVAVAAGYEHSLGLKGDGSIVAWGYNNYGQCNVPSPNSGFVAVAAVYEHSLGLKADGSIVAWGYNDYRQCNVPSPNSDYVAVAAGYSHSLGIRESGASPTQTPIPTLTPTPTPTKIPANTAPSVQVMTPPSPASGFISINYVLRDAQSDHVNLEVWFSINGGSSFIPASMGLGGDGITNLETTFNSVLHTYIWNTNSDIGSQLADNVKIKMRTFDGDLYSTKSTSGIFTVDNRASLPEITGIVKDIRSGEIIKGVLVELLSDITGELIDSDVTDTSGKYTVSAPDGNNVLKIKFSKVGYDPKEIRGFTAPMIMNINLNPGTPLSPTGLIAVSGASEVLVRWNPNMESDLAGYNVYRDTTTTGTFTKINIALVKETSYRDTSAMSGNEYYYKVTAVDKDANESLPAGPVKAVSGLVIVTVPDISGEKGTCVRIPINVDNAAGINPWGIDIDFRYNATLVDTVTSGVKIERTAVTSNVSFIANTQEPGRIRISSIGQADTLRGEGHLFDIYLWLRPDVPEGICGLLNFAEVKFYNEVPALIPADYTDTGLMCVSIECMQGDLNGDKMVDSADVIIALKMAVGLIIPTDCQMQSGDINGDGVIDSADALMIQRLSVGLPINPPQQGQGSEKSSIKDMTLRSLLGRKQAISIQVGQGQTSPGGYVFIPVEISDATGLSGLDMTIGYPSDRSTIILDSINSGSLTGNFQKTFYYGSGYAKVSMSSQSALTSGSGSLVVLKFRVSYTAPAPSAISITLNDIKLKGQYGDSFDWYSTIQKSDGEIQVLSTILTQKDFTDFLLGKTKSLYGDLNGDGKVDVADLVTLIINQP